MAENHALIAESAAMYPQTELKESKDLSQNLVSGDFEMQYRNRVLEQSGRRRQACFITSAATVAVLFVWLLVLTVLREVQIARLRQEVEQLSAHIVAVEASLNGLDQKVSNNRLFNDFKTLEDAIYADDDQEPVKSAEDASEYASLDKLHKLTILEDENMPDDDMSDDEDLYDESGDYYQDYDRRNNKKIGTTNMVMLHPEDFTDSVMKFDQGDKVALSKIRELQKVLNENPENPDIGPVLAATSAAAASPSGDRDKRSVFPDTAADMVDEFAAPRIPTKIEDRRKSKKFASNVEASPSKVPLHAITRTARNSEDGRPKPLIAAHFHGNTSHLSPEIHEHYKGNGLVRVAHDQPHNVWYPSSWTQTAPHPRPTLTRSGHVHVHHTGVYLVYVQIYYLDSHDIISWVLHRTNAETEGRETLLQCAQSSHSVERLDKPNSCFSAAALFLRAGDRLAVRNTGGDRHSLMEPEKSFIGLVKLGDAVDPFEEF
ncbi:protein eiger [Ostrinia nubilalis]|uniref:protein eiger n=1 Tax=Ostrinia nubilalis TaxID=29057 RepID=UPI0030824587